MLNRLTILYICVDPSMGGSTVSLFSLIESVKDQIYPIVLFSAQGKGYEYFTKNGIESYIYPFKRLHEFKANRFVDVWFHPWRWHYIQKWRSDYGCGRFINAVLNGRHVDIVHTNTSPNDVGVLLARKLHAKHVWHVREFLGTNYHFNVYRGVPYIRKKINKADARIAISSAIKEYWKMTEKNTWVIYDAIVRQSECYYCSDKEKKILFCSFMLTEAKGTRIAIQAFAKSGVAQLGYSLQLMGNCDDGYKESLQTTINQFGVSHSVEFVPCQEDVRPWLGRAMACLMASRNEGLGRVTAEAMFYGCPVIAHASGGTLDLVKDGETGYLFNTVEECAALLRKVCSSDNEKMILRAQEFVKDNLSQEVYGPKIMEVYNCVLER